MKKINSIVCFSIAALALASCGGSMDYKKTKSGLLYKVITNGKNPMVKEGDGMKFQITFKRERNDSILSTTYDKMPGYIKVAPVQGEAPYDIREIFPMMHQGDSVVTVQFVDTLMKKNPMGQLPPFLRKGDKIVTTVKVLKVYTSDSAFNVDREAEMAKDRVRQEAEQAKMMEKMKLDEVQDLKTQVPALEKWLTDQKITAKKAGSGTFVVLTTPGTGLNADTGKYASVRYTGKTMDGKVFQSNMDGSAPAYTFVVGTHSAISGWDEAMPLFKKGGKGTIYIPGALAYGRTPREGSPFKPNETLIFDIYVEDVSVTPPPPPGQQMPPQADTTPKRRKK